MLEDYLNKLAAERGQSKLAVSSNVDPGQFSKFLSHQGAMKLKDIENLLQNGKAVIVEQTYIDGLENAILTTSEMAKRYKVGK